jgi:hypothetical protein
MDEKKKSKAAGAETVEAVTQESAPAPAPKSEPAFPLDRLRLDCRRLFGVSTSTFNGAARGLTGEFTVQEIRGTIQNWQNKRVIPAIKKEVNYYGRRQIRQIGR